MEMKKRINLELRNRSTGEVRVRGGIVHEWSEL